MPTSREVVDLYYKYANAGQWDAWCECPNCDHDYPKNPICPGEFIFF